MPPQRSKAGRKAIAGFSTAPGVACGRCCQRAQTDKDVTKAFQDGASPNEREFLSPASLVPPDFLPDPKFPKTRQAQINFLADSLAGLGQVSPRRSRDICAEERRKEKHAHHIIRYEYWVECSCGYAGRSRDHACPKCGARILFLTGSRLEIDPSACS